MSAENIKPYFKSRDSQNSQITLSKLELKISNLFYEYREDTKSSPPPPKSSLVQKVVDSPESCVELLGFVVWFDWIDIPFRLNKN
jgi:hypothetical protein